MKSLFICVLLGCLILSGCCSFVDRSNNFDLGSDVEDDGWVEIDVKVNLRKEGTETNSPENSNDGELEIPLSSLGGAL